MGTINNLSDGIINKIKKVNAVDLTFVENQCVHYGIPFESIDITDDNNFFILRYNNTTSILANFNCSNKAIVSRIQERLCKFETPIPIYSQLGELNRLSVEAIKSVDGYNIIRKWISATSKLEQFNLLSIIYYQYLNTDSFYSKYSEIIYESLVVYSLGYERAAFISLVPLIEAGVRNIGENESETKSERLKRSIKQSIFKVGRERLQEYNHYSHKDSSTEEELNFICKKYRDLDYINSFRLFFENVFYEHTDHFEGNFNRHKVVHFLDDEISDCSYIKAMMILCQVSSLNEIINNKGWNFFGDCNDNRISKLSNYLLDISEKWKLFDMESKKTFL